MPQNKLSVKTHKKTDCLITASGGKQSVLLCRFHNIFENVILLLQFTGDVFQTRFSEFKKRYAVIQLFDNGFQFVGFLRDFFHIVPEIFRRGVGFFGRSGVFFGNAG